MSDSLTPFIYIEGDEWRFTLKEDMSISFPQRNFGKHRFFDGKNIERMRMDGSVITVLKSYSWDGSSPKFRLFGTWQGTPDYEATRLASMVHDSLMQYSHVACFPLKRPDCDKIFGEIMKSNKFPLWWVYYGAVAACGGIYYQIGNVIGGKREGTCNV